MEHGIVTFIFVASVWTSLFLPSNAAAPVCNIPPAGLKGYGLSCSSRSQCVTGLCYNSKCACDYGTTYSSCAVACVADCNGTLTTTTGMLTSPGYPSSSPTNYCSWIIQGSPGTIIALNIAYLEMGADDDCTADFIKIFDGPRTSSRTFGKKCTSWQTLTLSTTNYMLVVYNSSGIGRFLASYKSLDTNITLSEPKGFISSPGYPLGYLNNMFYTWTIQGDPNTFIVLDITDFYLEGGYFDYLKVYDGSTSTSNLFGTFCSSSSPGIIASTSNSMYLQFKTDYSVAFKGFYGNYEIRGRTTVIQETFGLIVSPGYPLGIHTNETYYWTILGDPGTSVNLDITSFELNGTSPNCTHYMLHIYDGSSNSSRLLYELCGTSVPDLIHSTSNSMHILFRTDEQNVYAGFKAIFYFQDLPYGKSCNRLDQCRSNLICVGGYCNCPSDTYYNNSTSTCYPTLDHYSDCNISVANKCNPSKYLECLIDVNGNPRCLCINTFFFQNSTCVSSKELFIQRPQLKIKSTTTVELQWEGSAHGLNISYSVTWVSASDETDRGAKTTNENGVTVTGLTPGTSYTITVYTFIQQQSFYSARNFSTIINIVTYPAQPGPVNTTASKLDKPPYIIRFQPSEGRVDYYTFSFESKLQIPKITVVSPEFTRSDLQIYTEYKYSIRAVNYNGDDSGEVEGSFKTAKSIDCNRVLTASSGAIMSPSYPSSSPTVYCTWTIQGSTGTIIALNITDTDMGEDDSCTDDYIEIFDGPWITSRTFGKKCTSWQTLTLSTTNYMYVVFQSTGSGKFLATYKFLGTNITLSERKGFISSPGYPLGYLNNMFYTWTIQGNSDTYIVLNITEILLEAESSCVYDYLKIYDGPTFNAPLLGMFCFLPLSEIIISTINYMHLEFKTDTSYSSSGFYGNYEIREINSNNSCTEIQQCKRNQQCVNGTCLCNKDYYYSKIDEKCTLALDHNLDCNNSIPDICKSSKHLDCLTDVDGFYRCLCMETYFFEDNSCNSSASFFSQRPQQKNKNTTGVELHWKTTTFGSNRSYSVSWVSDNDETDKGTQAANENGVTVTGLTPGTSYTITVYTIIQPQGYYPARRISTTLNVVTYPAQPGEVNITASKLDKPPYIIRFQPSEGRVDFYMFSFELKHRLPKFFLSSPEFELAELQADTEYNYSIKAVSSIGDKSVDVQGTFKTAKSEDCNRTLNATKGTITSPGYPSISPTTYCTWTIQGSPETIIAFNITHIDIGEDDSCAGDYIVIYDEPRGINKTLRKLCTSRQTLILSTTNCMLVEFRSVRSGRFLATFQIIEKNILLTEPEGYISSPGYPQYYQDNKFYTWTIQGYADTYIVLNFTDFRLEEKPNCINDYLKIYDGSTNASSLIGAFCSSSPGISFSTKNYMYIEFKTDESETSTGFYGHYKIRDIYKKACIDNRSCQSNLQCLNGNCTCEKDYYFRQMDAMCTPASGFNEKCTVCKYSLDCINSVCSCAMDHYYSTKDAMCTKALAHAIFCNNSVSGMCKASKNLDCLADVNGTQQCLCMEAFYFESNKCTPAYALIVQHPHAVNKNTTAVELQWEASTLGPNRTYSVSWVSASDETDRGTQAANESGVTVTGLTPGTSYKIAVYTVIQPQGYYPARNTSTTVNIVTYPAQPGLVNPTASKLDKPPYIIRFQPSEGRIENYMISFKSKRHELNKTVATHVVELSDLQADTEYNYSIKAVNSVGDKSSETEGGFKTANLEVETSIGMITGATMGSLVAVVLLVVFIIIFQYKIVDWMGEAKQKSRNREEQVDSRNENEETYDSLDDTINHMIVDADHYDKYNVLRGINPEFVQANIPPLPPRPQPNQYIDLGLVPIKNTQHSLNDMSIDLMYTGVTSDSQEEDNAEETNLIESNFLRLIDTSNVDCIEECDLSKLKRDLVDQTKESSENLDEISGESETTSTVKGYDSLMTRTARTEENKYFSFTDDLHNKISVDNDVINTDKDGYLTPTKPAEADNTRDETDDQTEIKNIDNDGYLSLINSSLDDEGHTLDSSDPKYIHVDSCQGSPSLPIKTDQIDEEDDQSYIHPIDPDDPSLPITYGYHKWDGAKDAGNHYIKDTEV